MSNVINSNLSKKAESKVLNFTNRSEKTLNLGFIYEKCRRAHPQIATSATGNVPRIIKTNLSVTEIIERLFVHGSFAAVVKYYDDITEEQIKDALAFSASFIQLACNPAQAGD